jgi:hypothetical protein
MDEFLALLIGGLCGGSTALLTLTLFFAATITYHTRDEA